jgi:hypothetical protein
MKTIFRLGLIAFLALSFTSCTKSVLQQNIDDTPPPSGDPGIVSKIYPFVNQPRVAELGNAATVFNTFEQVTIYVPHAFYQNDVQAATITMTDVATGLPIWTYDLLPSTHSSAASLTLPDDLMYASFMFVTVTLDEGFTGKTVSLNSFIQSSTISTTDVIENAFSVQ